MLAVVGFTGCSAEQLITLQGVIQNADTLSGTITVKMKDGSIQTFNFSDVKAETVIAALGGLSIEVGDEVTIKVDESGEVQEIEGSFAELEGFVQGLGADSVDIATEEGGSITLQITAETVIHIEDFDDIGIDNGGAADFTALQVGQQVEARYDVTSLEAVRIEIEDADRGSEQDEADDNGEGDAEDDDGQYEEDHSGEDDVEDDDDQSDLSINVTL
jgi:hypothetical protein